MATLLSLPNELIQQIACFLTCSTVLKLLRVNKRLHRACNDRFVFHYIARNGLYNTEGAIDHLRQLGKKTVNVDSSQFEWTEGSLAMDGASLEQTALVAFAVERCIRAVSEINNAWTLRVCKGSTSFELSRWLPQMIAWHHPATLGLSPVTFLPLQGFLSASSPQRSKDDYTARSQRSADSQGINFVLSYTTLSYLRLVNDPKHVIDRFEKVLHTVRLKSDPDSSDEERAVEGAVANLSSRIPGYRRYSPNFSSDQAQVLLPAMILKFIVQYGDTLQLNDLPSPSKIPFHSFMDIPPVFDSTAQGFHTCHVRKMVTPEFLSGQWMGYYSDHRAFRHGPWFDPPMHDISLLVRSPQEGDSTTLPAAVIVDQHSRGVDSHGEFTLEGKVSELGAVQLMKKYITHPWEWFWHGRVTPFGIIGMWGDNEHFGGYFWIWKKEWSYSLSEVDEGLHM